MTKKTIMQNRYTKEFRKADLKDKYRVYEKYAIGFGIDIKDENKPEFWKIYGEAISIYATITIYETKESIKRGQNNRPDYMNKFLGKGMKNKLLRKWPKKCRECGFWRFFAVSVTESSVGRSCSILCPNCGIELREIDNFDG